MLLACTILVAAQPARAEMTPEEASRFLASASFGPTQAEIDALSLSSREAWLAEQFALPPSHHLPLVRADYSSEVRRARIEAWWQISLHAPDQLRQRVAFALSEIFVVSDRSDQLYEQAEGLAWYYDLLVDGAFGNYRDVLEAVTLAPAMGRYLSMLGNAKADPEAGTRADENYARESMQLFSIGLVKLNKDGTPKLNDRGETRPSYTQADIENLARVFTGWSWDSPVFYSVIHNWEQPMKAFPDFHDSGEKTIVDGVVIPAGQTPEQDLKLALDTLFNHPNTPPFISKQLIQRLVTSNPSPEYVSRVASVFKNNGLGVRGDLRAVVEAILLDAEAIEGRALNPVMGKPREPLLMLTHLWRSFDGRTARRQYRYWIPQNYFDQAPLSAPSVFNFFSPAYSPLGPVRDQGLVAPEFQLLNESSKTRVLNELARRIYDAYRIGGNGDAMHIQIDIAPTLAVADKIGPLLDQMDLLLMGGQMPEDMRDVLGDYLRALPYDSGQTRVPGVERALDAIYLTISSPFYAVQH